MDLNNPLFIISMACPIMNERVADMQKTINENPDLQKLLADNQQFYDVIVLLINLFSLRLNRYLLNGTINEIYACVSIHAITC